MLKLDLSHKARRFLDTLDAKQFRQILKTQIPRWKVLPLAVIVPDRKK